MNKVYCVFSGAYSDRSLHAVFSSYDKAMGYIKIQKAFFEMLFSGVPEESRKIFEHVMEQTEENLNIYQKENKKK